MEIVTSWYTLMHYAKALGKACQSGKAEAIAKAQAEHDAYRDMCLKADRMTLNIPWSSMQ